MTLVQTVLGGIGAFLATLYDWVGNYGIAILVLTLAIRLLLTPLFVKQLRSQRAMAALQPRMKQLKEKYKGNQQKYNEEVMALYRERGVNPLLGCLPMLAQVPVLIALFAVLNMPKGLPHLIGDPQRPTALYEAIVHNEPGIRFLGANLLCSAVEAGSGERALPPEPNIPKADQDFKRDCGSGVPTRIPYYVFAILMVGTTYFQQRQMQRASPQAPQQQQALTRIMPLIFGIWGFVFPAGLVIYWTMSNLVQIGQQTLLLPRIAEDGGSGTTGGDGAKRLPAGAKPARTSSRRTGASGAAKRTAAAKSQRVSGGTSSAASSRKGAGSSAGSEKSGQGSSGSGGGSRAGDRKKRRKR